MNKTYQVTDEYGRVFWYYEERWKAEKLAEALRKLHGMTFYII